MRASEFRSDPSLVSQWAGMLENHELLKLVLGVMESEHPTRFIVQGDDSGDISPTMANIALGETRGYSKYSNGLRLLGMPQLKAQPMPEPTYQSETEEVPAEQPRPARKTRTRKT